VTAAVGHRLAEPGDPLLGGADVDLVERTALPSTCRRRFAHGDAPSAAAAAWAAAGRASAMRDTAVSSCAAETNQAS